MEKTMGEPERLDRLLREYYRGNDESLDEIGRLLRRRLEYVAFRKLGNYNDAENAVQETWLKVVHHRPAENSGQVNVLALLYRICLNCCNDLLRKRRLPGNNAEPLDGLPEPQCEEKEHRRRYNSLLLDQLIAQSGLTASERMVVDLRRVGLSNGEIAETMGLDDSTVSNYFRSAKAKMLLAGERVPVGEVGRT